MRPVVKSLNDCAQHFDAVLIESTLSEDIGASFDDLLRSYQELIFAFSSFEEACEQIVLCIVDDPNPTKHSLYKEFGKRKRSLNDTLGRTANAIKHRGGQLRPLLAMGIVARRYRVIPALFVEGYQPEYDAMGPDPVVHKGGRSAYSVIRQIRYYLVHLYLLSAWLCEVLVKRFDKVTYSSSHVVDEKVASQLEHVLRLGVNADRVVLPNEFGKPQPDLRFGLTGEGTGLIATYAESKDFLPLERGRFLAQSYADGHVRSIRPPYFGQALQEEW